MSSSELKPSIVDLRKTLTLLRLEKDAESKEYAEVFLKKPLSLRVKDGATWWPCKTDSLGFGLGAYPYIVLERTTEVGKPHRFKAGAVVSVFLEQEIGGKQMPYQALGIVAFVEKNRMKISFYSDDMPSWLEKGRLGVNLSFDERSYREMENAMARVIEATDNRSAELREVLLGSVPPRFQEGKFPVFAPHLNESQNKAVQEILAAEDVAIVHGPPGTGKTTTVVQAIRQLVKEEPNILVCAPSNPAVDLLAERLNAEGVRVLRLGNISRVDESLFRLTLEGQLQDRPEMQEVKRLKIEAAQAFRKAGNYKRNFDDRARDSKKEAYQEAKTLTQYARILEQYTVDKVLAEAEVICCTLVGAASEYLKKRRFKTVVIDEAAQALEPSCWIPILKADRVVFAGDPFQLPPTVKSNEAIKGGYNVTLMEKAIHKKLQNTLLNIQYRMNETIMGFSNEQFYGGELKAADFVKYRTLTLADGDERPLEFIDTAGCSFDEKVNPETKSRYNPDEYFVIRQHLDDLLARSPERSYSIGIISPYKEQVGYIAEAIKKDFDHFPKAELTIDTIDAFQGQERDVIYISLVRSNDRGEIGFLSDTRRMNVAMTRAKMKLIVIGDSATLAKHGFYNAFQEYCERENCYRSAWEFWTG